MRQDTPEHFGQEPGPTWPPTVDARSEPITVPRRQRGMRIRTVVFGLVLLLLAGCVTLGDTTDVHVDAGAVAILALIGAGALLLAGAAAAAGRERRGE